MQFISNDSGAITVDWVVLTAALVGLGLATMGVVSSGVENASGDVSLQLQRSGNLITTSFAVGYDPVPCTPSTALEQKHSELYCAMNSVETLMNVNWAAGDASAYFAEIIETYETVDDASLMASIATMTEQDYIDTQASIDEMIALIDQGATEEEVRVALGLPEIHPFTGQPMIADGEAEDYLMRQIAGREMNLHFQTARIAVAQERGLM